MKRTSLFSLISVIIAFYIFDVVIRERIATNKARKRATELGKSLLNVGSGTKGSSFTGPKLRGDINCDLAAPKDATCGAATVCYCNAEDLSRFKDKQFGVALIVNVLGYVPNKKKALAEMHRVADEVFISNNILPWPQIGPGPTFPIG